MTVTRVARGVPAGGQFAPSRRRESAQDLGQWAEIKEAVHSSALFWARRCGLDSDDVEGQSLLALVETVGKRGFPTKPKAYAEQVVRSVAVPGDAPTHRALRALEGEEQEYAQQHGGQMTQRLRAEAAERIRAAQPPRRRAKIGFHEPRPQFVPYESVPGATLTTGMSRMAEEQVRPEPEDLRKVSVRKFADAWTAFSPSAPQPRPGSLARKQAERVRAVVESYGGPEQIATDWVHGDAPKEASDALFAPFGDIPGDERYQIHSILRRHPDFSERLWLSALKASSRS